MNESETAVPISPLPVVPTLADDQGKGPQQNPQSDENGTRAAARYKPSASYLLSTAGSVWKSATQCPLKFLPSCSRGRYGMTGDGMKFRIYGDNIVECERITNIILHNINYIEYSTYLVSPSVTGYKIRIAEGWLYLELLPGFNKANRRRWSYDIFEALRAAGSILGETPDVLMTRVDGEMETILFALEFCSALQAGNQAWQRSGRAFSIGRTDCPYIYVVDFVKYELDSATRERKALRFPNPLVPFSYIRFSEASGNFTLQAYVKSEEFEPAGRLATFPQDSFADDLLAEYILLRMFSRDTREIEQRMLEKSRQVVNFLAGGREISLSELSHPYRKTIAGKSLFGQIARVQQLCAQCGLGLDRDFPLGLIPAACRKAFADGLQAIYPDCAGLAAAIGGNAASDLVICMIKGFKPRGDDNRPDRGILPLAAMLFPQETEIFTIIYGPILRRNLELLRGDKNRLCDRSGFWNVLLCLSDVILLDAPILPQGTVTDILDNRRFKQARLAPPRAAGALTFPTFSATPLSYHEDDVDTAIHFMFAHRLHDMCFEGLCNPPGGDWSGLSLLMGNTEFRWLSLPRVSAAGKRPDHVLELFGCFAKPVLLIIESKENSSDLESGVGIMLRRYVEDLMRFVPNVERNDGQWHMCGTYIAPEAFEMFSAAAYLASTAQTPEIVFAQTGCDLLMVLAPSGIAWHMELFANPASEMAQQLRDFIIERLGAFVRSSGTGTP